MTYFGASQPTGTERLVCKDIAERQRLGIAKYKTTVADNPLSLRQWLQHQYEELLDAAVYTKRAIQELDKSQADTRVFCIDDAEPPAPESGFAKL